MPGPRFGFKDQVSQDFDLHGTPFRVAHKYCQNGEKCTGPGCAANTGKTRRNRTRGKARRFRG